MRYILPWTLLRGALPHGHAWPSGPPSLLRQVRAGSGRLGHCPVPHAASRDLIARVPRSPGVLMVRYTSLMEVDDQQSAYGMAERVGDG